MSATDISAANIAAAISTVDLSPANFQVYTSGIAIATLFSIFFVLGTLIVIVSLNQTMNGTTFMGLVIANIVFVVLFFLAYVAYLRNIGKYVYSRIKVPRLKLA